MCLFQFINKTQTTKGQRYSLLMLRRRNVLSTICFISNLQNLQKLAIFSPNFMEKVIFPTEECLPQILYKWADGIDAFRVWHCSRNYVCINVLKKSLNFNRPLSDRAGKFFRCYTMTHRICDYILIAFPILVCE